MGITVEEETNTISGVAPGVARGDDAGRSSAGAGISSRRKGVLAGDADGTPLRAGGGSP